MISFFANPSYIGRGYHAHMAPHATRLSSRIRAEEISSYLGARFNPTEGYENDVCIHVKPQSLENIRDSDWVDFLDSWSELEEWLGSHPKVKVIAGSQSSYDHLKTHLPNEVVLIPSHHLNFERAKRQRQEISVAGYIGSPSLEAVEKYAEIARRLKEVGYDFKTCFDFKTRQDAANFYLSLDLFVIYPVGGTNPHSVPTKPINAASFGIPTIACPQNGYQEIDEYYAHASTVDEVVIEARKFKDPVYHAQWADKISAFAEEYHISKIAELYRQLT